MCLLCVCVCQSCVCCMCLCVCRSHGCVCVGHVFDVCVWVCGRVWGCGVVDRGGVGSGFVGSVLSILGWRRLWGRLGA